MGHDVSSEPQEQAGHVSICKGEVCVVNLPLLNIPLDHIVLDELHLLLCITDVLLCNIIMMMVKFDCSAPATNPLQNLINTV